MFALQNLRPNKHANISPKNWNLEVSDELKIRVKIAGKHDVRRKPHRSSLKSKNGIVIIKKTL